jgi:hypothetical protein
MTTDAAPAADCGVTYLAFGARFLEEAEASAASLKAHNPGLPVTVFTNAPGRAACFDQVLPITAEQFHKTLKPQCLLQSPYARTLYLDTDAYVCGDVTDLFPLLDRFEFAATYTQGRVIGRDLRYMPDMVGQVPWSFPQFNSGAMLYGNNETVRRMLARWADLIEQNDHLAEERKTRLTDQTPLREAVYLSDVQLLTLPLEYNCRGRMGFLRDRVRVLHGRFPQPQVVAEQLNRFHEPRVFVIGDDRRSVFIRRVPQPANGRAPARAAQGGAPVQPGAARPVGTARTTAPRGIVYVAHGPSHAVEATRSALSAKALMPELPIALFTSEPVSSPAFDEVVQLPADEFRPAERARCLLQSPFERTLYLDTDTLVGASILELFDLLDRFDVAAAFEGAPLPSSSGDGVPGAPQGVPRSFALLDTSVLLFRNEPPARQMLAEWAGLLERSAAPGHRTDRAALREAVYRTSVRVAILAPEYNCSVDGGGCLHGVVGILHGRGTDLAQAAKTINRAVEPRIYVSRGNGIEVRGRSPLAPTALTKLRLGGPVTAITWLRRWLRRRIRRKQRRKGATQ